MSQLTLYANYSPDNGEPVILVGRKVSGILMGETQTLVEFMGEIQALARVVASNRRVIVARLTDLRAQDQQMHWSPTERYRTQSDCYHILIRLLSNPSFKKMGISKSIKVLHESSTFLYYLLLDINPASLQYDAFRFYSELCVIIPCVTAFTAFTAEEGNTFEFAQSLIGMCLSRRSGAPQPLPPPLELTKVEREAVIKIRDSVDERQKSKSARLTHLLSNPPRSDKDIKIKYQQKFSQQLHDQKGDYWYLTKSAAFKLMDSHSHLYPQREDLG